MSNSSIALRFVIVLLFVLGLLGTASVMIFDKVYRQQMHEKASVVADNVEVFGEWVAKYGRVWVDKDPDSSFLQKREVVFADRGRVAGRSVDDWIASHSRTLYAKNPALAQREYAEVAAETGSLAKFRMTSDNFMNPRNRPDGFEAEAIASIKKTGAPEFQLFDEQSGVYRYARAVHHKPACITCHGDPQTAPRDVVDRYGTLGGFGYRNGDVAGVISVSLPLQPFGEVMAPLIGLGEILLLLSALAIPVLFMVTNVLQPIRRLSRAATRASTGDTEELELPAKSPDTRNEIHQLGLAIRRLNTSTRIAVQRMQGRPAEHDIHEID